MKLCKDCKHLERELWCKSPQNGISLVTGTAIAKFAQLNRKYDCGESAKFFEPIHTIKKPWWKFWEKKHESF